MDRYTVGVKDKEITLCTFKLLVLCVYVNMLHSQVWDPTLHYSDGTYGTVCSCDSATFENSGKMTMKRDRNMSQ